MSVGHWYVTLFVDYVYGPYTMSLNFIYFLYEIKRNYLPTEFQTPALLPASASPVGCERRDYTNRK